MKHLRNRDKATKQKSLSDGWGIFLSAGVVVRLATDYDWTFELFGFGDVKNRCTFFDKCRHAFALFGGGESGVKAAPLVLQTRR